ncbi:terminase large subunit [Agrobacterium phage Atu_ph07]|uniref:Terminase large subunit n=1 Tax=Agrobacterium phage Atu_ph07 TaxID=2024264 RepID=A0A223W0U0_9CAUD|nr:terminase large subunit [Agrobacterium phage Atu_ph07]ASV44708.1 terminase large subunit [Agrobacterium phage Atu_ph07]
MSSTPNFTKKANALDTYNQEREAEILRCASDPIYFIENYVQVQHAIKGRLPFVMYDYQKEMVNGFTNNTRVIAMCGRQLGKSVHKSTDITYNDKQVKIKSLIKLSLREKIVEMIEDLILKLVR